MAASLKIPQRMLEALERDRYDELPDAAFARALAITVCRALKVDAAPVLALLPRANTGSLDQVSGGLNQPFRDHAAGEGGPALATVLRHPTAVIVLLLLAAALAVWLWPRTLPETDAVEPGLPLVVPPLMESLPPDLSPAASEPLAADDAASQAVADGVAAIPSPDAAASATVATPTADAPQPNAVAPQANSADALLAIRVREDTWVQVVDGTDRILLSRTVAAGTTVTTEGVLPLQLIIGNAGATELQFRGEAVDLGPATSGNVARLQLK
jgi:cytoskeleton protein RodZ